ncbi:MAG: hypothetical protein ACFCD0_19390 [Gemmataceae bacterium]
MVSSCFKKSLAKKFQQPRYDYLIGMVTLRDAVLTPSWVNSGGSIVRMALVASSGTVTPDRGL